MSLNICPKIGQNFLTRYCPKSDGFDLWILSIGPTALLCQKFCISGSIATEELTSRGLLAETPGTKLVSSKLVSCMYA